MSNHVHVPNESARSAVRRVFGLGAAAFVGAAVAVVIASPLGERLTRGLAEGARRASHPRADDPFSSLETEGSGLFV
jgi:hypothetical protein